MHKHCRARRMVPSMGVVMDLMVEIQYWHRIVRVCYPQRGFHKRLGSLCKPKDISNDLHDKCCC